MVIVGQHGYQMTPNRHLSSLSVVSGISDHVITDYDVIIRDLRQNYIQSTKNDRKNDLEGLKGLNKIKKG